MFIPLGNGDYVYNCKHSSPCALDSDIIRHDKSVRYAAERRSGSDE